MIRVSFSIIIGILLSATSAVMAASALPTATPDAINMTVQKAEISSDDLSFITIFDNPTPGPVSLTTSTNPVFGQKDQIPVGTYRVLRLTVTEISWHASWSPANPSPCDGVTTSGEANGTVDLSGHTIFYFKTPDLGGNTLAYYQSHPPLSGYVGDALHPFVLVSPVQVLKDTVTPVNLVIGVADTLSCDSLSIFSRTAGGDAAALRTLRGPATRLNGAEGVYVDTLNKAIGVINSGNNSVTVYDRIADGDAAPIRHPLIGPATRLNQPAGIYVDTINDEIGVTNQGNDTVTVYSRTASDNSAPLRILTGTQTGISRPKGIYVDSAADEILVTNAGNNSVTIFNRKAYQNASPYRTIQGDLTELSNPCGIYVDADRGEIGVANTDTNSVTIYSRDDLNKRVGISKGYADLTSTVRDPGALSGKTFTLDFSETVAFPDITVNVVSTTTLSDLAYSINNDHVGNYDITPGNPRVTATLTPTSPYRLIITSNLVEPAKNVTVGGTLLSEITDFWSDGGNIVPVRTISGSSTELSSPCGLYLDPTNNEIAVANGGNNSITIYDRDADGDVAPIRTISGPGTGLNGPVGIYRDTDEIGVVHKGQSVVMAQLPFISPSGTDGNASTSVLAGDYNVVLYGVDIKGTDAAGVPIPVVFMERGTAAFDPSPTPWPSFILQLDTQLEGRISTPDCPAGADVGVLQSGFYSVNHDGSFYAFIPGIQGSLRGAFLPDGTAFVGAMVDNSKKMMLVYGVKTTGAFTPYLTSDGTLSGGGTHYAFARYRNSPLDNMLGIGMADTDASYFQNTSGDANIIRIGSGLIRYSQDEPDLRLNAPQQYASYPGGFFNNPADGMSGAITTNGAAFIFARDTIKKDNNGCPSEIGFGMGLRQGPAGTFTTAGIKGTYFAAAFGDLYEITTGTRPHRSTAVRLDFDGAGSVKITTIENATGMISTDNSSYTYQISTRQIPSVGDTSLLVDVVDIFDQQPAAGPYASALIGQDGMTLGFFRNLNPGGTANRTRLLGLAVLQHS